MFGYSKLDVMFGRETPEAVRLYYRDIVKPSVTFRQETILLDRPGRASGSRPIAASYDTDVLVVALGADVAPELTPGVVEDGNEFYTVAGAERVRDVVSSFDARRRDHQRARPVLQVPGRAVRDRDDAARRAGATRRARRVDDQGADADGDADPDLEGGVGGNPAPAWTRAASSSGARRSSPSIDPATKTATLRDGRTINYDLFLAIPVHSRAGGRRGVGNDGRRLDPGRPHDVRDPVPGRVRGRRRDERAGAATSA